MHVFLNDRLTFSMDYFDKKTKDLLVSGTTPSLIIGGSTSPMNAGNVSNKGWEFELDGGTVSVVSTMVCVLILQL